MPATLMLKMKLSCPCFHTFDLKPHLERLIENRRVVLNIDDLYADINWNHIQSVTQLHSVNVLVSFVPQLAHLQPEVSCAFHSLQLQSGVCAIGVCAMGERHGFNHWERIPSWRYKHKECIMRFWTLKARWGSQKTLHRGFCIGLEVMGLRSLQCGR